MEFAPRTEPTEDSPPQHHRVAVALWGARWERVAPLRGAQAYDRVPWVALASAHFTHGYCSGTATQSGVMGGRIRAMMGRIGSLDVFSLTLALSRWERGGASRRVV